MSQVLGMIASFVTARLLGKVGVGEVGIVLSTLGAFGVFAGFGVGLTSTKYVAEFRLTDPGRAGRILGLSRLAALSSGAIITVVLFLVSENLASGMLKAPHLVFELRMGCLLLLVNALQETQGGALAGFEAFRQIARINLLRGLLYFPLVMGGVLLFGVRGAIAANVAVAVIGYLLSGAAIRDQCRQMNIVVSMRGVMSELSVLRNFTIPAFLGGVMVAPVIWLVNTILVNQPGGYGELGLLSAANQWRTFLMFLPAAFLQVALPMMAIGATNSETAVRQYGKTFSLTRSLTLLAVFPPAVVLMLVSSWIVKLYGRQFAGAEPVLIGVISSVMVVATSSAVGPAIQAEGKLWFGFLQNISWGVLLLLFAAFAAPVWGAVGVAFSFALSYGVLAIWSFLYLRPSLPARTVSRLFISLIFIAVVGASALAMSPVVRIAMALPAGVVTVAVTLLFLVDEPVKASIVQSFSQKWRAYSKPRGNGVG